MKKLFNFTAPVLLLSVGLFLMAASTLFEKLGLPSWFPMLILLAAFNYLLACKLGLLKRFWSIVSLNKIHHLFVGFVLGVLPVSAGVLYTGEAITFDSKFSLATFGVTLAIVSWEEFWFRGILLDYAARAYSEFGAMIVFSFAFVLLYALNPNLNLLEAAPDLFFGSLLLSVSYFLFKSIWAPIGIHFGNNYFDNLWTINGEPSMAAVVACEIALCLILLLFFKRLSGPVKTSKLTT